MQKYYFCPTDRHYFCFFIPNPLSHQQKLRFGYVLNVDKDPSTECVRIPIQIPINTDGEGIEDWFEQETVTKLLDRIGRGYKWLINEDRDGFAQLDEDAQAAYVKLKELIDKDLPLLRGGGIQAESFFKIHQKQIDYYITDMVDEGGDQAAYARFLKKVRTLAESEEYFIIDLVDYAYQYLIPLSILLSPSG